MDSSLIIISLGGSLIVPNSNINVTFLKNFRELIIKNLNKKQFFIVAGGGDISRHYQKAASGVVKLASEDIDWLGIHATHLNAHLLRTIFRGFAHPKVITHYDEKEPIKERVTIAAGWKPGHSTDFDAVMLAKLYKADTVINLTDVDYVYDKDPHKFPDAVALKEISWKDFIRTIGSTWNPGDNLPFDPIASQAAQKIGIKVAILNGKNLQNLQNFLDNKDFKGTIIS